MVKSNNSEDLEIEDIIDVKKKKVKGKPKGKRGELEIVNDLNLRFEEILSKNPSWGRFSRSVGSGNRWGQGVYLSKAANSVFSGDLSVPTGFKFTIEIKTGYNDIDLYNCFDGDCKDIDNFLEQASKDAERSGRAPLLIWKKDRKPKLAFVQNLSFIQNAKGDYPVFMHYKDWLVIPLKDFLRQSDDYFFE